MAQKIRRVVTGHNEAGKSIFIMDGPAPNVMSRGTASTEVTELWETGGAPASNAGKDDPTDHPYRLPPPQRGTVFRIIEYPPDKVRVAALRNPQQTTPRRGARGLPPRPRQYPPSGLPQDRHDRLCDRAQRRDLGAHGRGRGAC